MSGSAEAGFDAEITTISYPRSDPPELPRILAPARSDTQPPAATATADGVMYVLFRFTDNGYWYLHRYAIAADLTITSYEFWPLADLMASSCPPVVGPMRVIAAGTDSWTVWVEATTTVAAARACVSP